MSHTAILWHIDEINVCESYIDVMGWYRSDRDFQFVLGELEYPRVWFMDRNLWKGHIFWDIHNIEINTELLHQDNHYDRRTAQDIASLFSLLAEKYFS